MYAVCRKARDVTDLLYYVVSDSSIAVDAMKLLFKYRAKRAVLFSLYIYLGIFSNQDPNFNKDCC